MAEPLDLEKLEARYADRRSGDVKSADLRALVAECKRLREEVKNSLKDPAVRAFLDDREQLRKERDELKSLLESATKLVMPGETDTADAYLKLLRGAWEVVEMLRQSRDHWRMLSMEQDFGAERAQNLRYREALEKIADPRKRDHREPDAYTELGCVMNIASEALKESQP